MTKFLFLPALALASVLTSMLIPAVVFAADMSAQQIMQKNKDVMNVQDVLSDAVLKTGDKTKTFHWWRKLTPDGLRFNTLIKFDSPVEVRGQGVLFLEYENGENDVLIYLPTYKKVRRVESQSQSSSFMASEFSYSDIANPRLSDYKYKTIKTEACAGAPKCAMIEAVPSTEKVQEATGYSKKLVWIRLDNFAEVRADFYDRTGKLAKKMTALNFTKLPKTEKWMSMEIDFTNAVTNKSSSLKFSNVKANTGLDDSIFTEQNLSRQK